MGRTTSSGGQHGYQTYAGTQRRRDSKHLKNVPAGEKKHTTTFRMFYLCNRVILVGDVF